MIEKVSASVKIVRDYTETGVHATFMNIRRPCVYECLVARKSVFRVCNW